MISTARGHVTVARPEADDEDGSVAATLEPGDAYEEIPYDAWEAMLGKEVDVEAYRQELMTEGAQGYTAAHPKQKWPEVVACPRCGESLLKGKLRIEPTVAGVLLAGFSYEHLFFTPSDGGDRTMVLNQNTGARGARCPRCGGVWIADAPSP